MRENIKAYPGKAVPYRDRAGDDYLVIPARLKAMDFEDLAAEAMQDSAGAKLVTQLRADLASAACGPCMQNKLTSKLRVYLAKKGDNEKA